NDTILFTYLLDGTKNILKHNGQKQGSKYTDFAFRFYKQTISEEDDKNIFFSPISLSTTFVIFGGLGFGSLTETCIHDMHENFHKLLAVLNCTDVNITLNIGNVFPAICYELQETFLQNIQRFYDADFFLLIIINRKKLIPELIAHLDANTILVLVYFKGTKPNIIFQCMILKQNKGTVGKDLKKSHSSWLPHRHGHLIACSTTGL
uniref:Serpin domain-containing protein n=1 Tax=Meleagris gallopavo TaxID=9103 RepID=A0A803YMQ2_MELGA